MKAQLELVQSQSWAIEVAFKKSIIKLFSYVRSGSVLIVNKPYNNHETGTVIPILQMKKLRQQEIKLVQGQPVDKL